MAQTHSARVVWERGAQPFIDHRYSRAHLWHFDEGVVVPASSSPHVVRLPLSRADAVDPEEAFVAALSSCHMLFFLDFAAREGFCIDRYDDEAEGVMGRNDAGMAYVARVTLKPRLIVSGEKRLSVEDVTRLHARAHHECFLANSVRTEVVALTIAPVFT